MKDKLFANETIGFTLNGKPIDPYKSEPTWTCPKCGTDRLKHRCPLEHNTPRMLVECPMIVKAQ